MNIYLTKQSIIYKKANKLTFLDNAYNLALNQKNFFNL